MRVNSFHYIASDDDLPEIFWPGGKAPESKPVDAVLQAEVAVGIHYSAIEREKAERRKQRAVAFENRSALAEIRGKQYIKFEKKEQMNSWLESLAAQHAAARMSPYEERFFADLFGRFEAYFPAVKWITQKQYEFLKSLAAKYLALPNRDVA